MLLRITTYPYRHYFLCSSTRTSSSGGTLKIAVFSSTQAQYDSYCESSFFHQVGTRLPVTHYGFVKLLSEAAKSSTLLIGEQLHSAITKLGLTANVFVCTALLDVYSKCLGVKLALQLFEEMPLRNVVTWNTILYGHSQSKHPEHALEAFSQMLDAGIPPTHFSVSTVLIGCSHLEDPAAGASMHCVCLKMDFAPTS
ncbi:hypothetical protein HPP92_020756 [Vanilla planifolia]|uniref:Pentatricopeptide repeat-containing protein n=1 Tax=Vanilla planifolia TaxID=51239 RepID=A0A835UIS2_VANPL|nr:hypothetical protein HPP92_020756 [Vanilla planifolia]